jgi:long-chain fatty acid transport protein
VRTRAGLLAGAALSFATNARATSALEYADNGTAQFSRGGAWLATATDPIAGYYNPAALARQATSFQLGFNLPIQKICYQRRGPDGEKTGPSSFDTSRGNFYPETCNSNSGQPNLVPNLGFTWRAMRGLGVGLTVVPPSSYGLVEYPDRVPIATRAPIPAPQRYLSLYLKGTILFPTLSVGYSLTDRLHVGAGFVAGIAILETHSNSMATVDEDQLYDDFNNDSHSRIEAKDLFIPGFVASTLFEANDNIDLAAWYRFSDKIKAKGDLTVIAPYYTGQGVRRTLCEPGEDPTADSCANTTKTEDVAGKDKAKLTITIPMEIRIGARWHMPRKPAVGLEAEGLRKDTHPVRDPLRDDLYDLELDLSWANNSAAEETEVRFPGNVNVEGTPGFVPQNADRPTGWKDSFGARLGFQYNAMRNTLGLRTGTWIETPAVDDEYLTVTGVPALRGGFGGGVVFRIQAVDLEFGYQHIWNAGLDNDGDGKLRAIAGTGSPDNRSYHAVNGGKVSQHANVFSAGAVARF